MSDSPTNSENLNDFGSDSEEFNADFQIYEINEKLRAEIGKLGNEINSLNDQNVDLAMQLADFEDLQENYNAKEAELSKANDSLTAQNAKLDFVTKQYESEQQKNIALQKEAERLQQNIVDLTQRVQDLELQLAKANGDLEISAQQMTALNEQIAKLTEANARSKHALETFKLQYFSRASSEQLQAVSVPAKTSSESNTVGKVESILVEVLGSTGSVVFKRVCKTKGINPGDSADDTQANAKILAEAVKAPALKLCRNDEKREQLQSLIDAFLADETSPKADEPVVHSAPVIEEAPAAAPPSTHEVAPSAPTPIASSTPPPADLPPAAPLAEEAVAPAPAKSAAAPAPSPEPIAEAAPMFDIPKREPLPSNVARVLRNREICIKTFIPNQLLNGSQGKNYQASFAKMLDSSPATANNAAEAILSNLLHNPEKFTPEQRRSTTIKDVSRISPAIAREALDSELDQIVTWLNYFVTIRHDDVQANHPEINSILPIRDERTEAVTQLAQTINKNITKIGGLNISFYRGSGLTSSFSKPHPTLLLHTDILEMPQAQIAFLLSGELFTMRRGSFGIQQAIGELRKNYPDPSSLGSALLKRAMSNLVERNILLPPDLLGATSSLWGTETVEELTSLLDRCYEASKFANFLYIKEILSNPHALEETFAIERDGFALNFSNVLDATLAIIRRYTDADTASCLAERGFAEVFTANDGLTDLKQQLHALWLSFYATALPYRSRG